MPERYVLARITVTGQRFEILVKPNPALDYRLGKMRDIDKVLADYDV